MKIGVIAVFILVIFLLVGAVAFWTQSNLEFWLTYFKHSAVSVNYWLAFVLTAVLNGAGILINIIAEILKLLVK